MKLTIQTRLDQAWHDAAILSLPDSESGSRGNAELSYSSLEYALEHLGERRLSACSLLLPVMIAETYRSKPWFRFLDDIMPAGAARRHWVNTLGIADQTGPRQDARLLAAGTIAPVGNLRIKESVPEKIPASQLRHYRFTIADVVERQTDFLEYAQEMGAASGGATGAGGEAPKLLLRCSPQNEIWIDTWQDEPHILDQHYLVKFPRNQRSEIDCDILRTEYHYYHELHAMGVDTIDVNKIRLIEGSRYPSLWIPRFDVSYGSGQEKRYGLESIYSIMQKESGSYLNQFDVVRRLSSVIQQVEQKSDVAEFTCEWVRRDLLNIAFGNSDNHGRNSAILKSTNSIRLAPVYDFAPMKADPEGVTRSTKWGIPFEEGGNFRWIEIAEALSDLAPPEQILEVLRAQAQDLKGLADRLRARGASEPLLSMPTFGFQSLEKRLTN